MNRTTLLRALNVAALSAALFALYKSCDSSSAPLALDRDPRLDGMEGAIAQAHDTLNELRRSVELNREAIANQRAPRTPVESTTEPSITYEQGLADRITRLERAVRDAVLRIGDAGRDELRMAPLSERSLKEARRAIQQLKSIVLDRTQPDRQRGDAIADLGQLPEQLGALDDTVLDEAMHLLANSTSERAKLQAIRGTSRTRNSRLVPGLMESLQRDPSAKVRQEAAEALGGFLEFPGVRGALIKAEEEDPSYLVKHEAQRSLAGR